MTKALSGVSASTSLAPSALPLFFMQVWIMNLVTERVQVTDAVSDTVASSRGGLDRAEPFP